MLLAALVVLQSAEASNATTTTGRLLAATGDLQGGIIEFNTDGSNGVSLTSTGGVGQSTNNTDGQYKSDYPSVASNGRRRSRPTSAAKAGASTS